MNRRDFLKVSGAASAGLVLGVSFPARARASEATVADLGAFIQIAPDDAITIWVSKSDMGQDVRTALPMIVAEELDADWNRVRIRQAPLDPKYGRMGTGGSGSIRTMWTPMRQAGANGRAMLVAAAAAKLGVAADSLTVERGVITHSASGRSVKFGEVADAAAKIKLDGDAKLKDPSQFRIVGKATTRLDVADIVTGKATYGLDVKLPGMLYAVIARSPSFGATLKSFDATKAKAVPGVRDVVRVDAIGTDLPWNGVAVVANSTWAAMKGRDALKVEWNDGPHASESTESLRKQLRDIVENGRSITTRGDVSTIAKASKKVEAEYEVPFLAHATMEPLNAVAHVTADGAEVWTGTQFPDWVGSSAAKLLGVAPEKVKVNVTLLGGGFGRRANPDFALEAVQVSKAVGAPVKVTWTREDDMQHDYYRPASLHRVSASLDDAGNVAAWHHRIAAPSINGFLRADDKERQHLSETPGVHDMPYEVPNFRTDFAFATSGVPRGWWRSVEHSINGFVMNAFLDELAHAAGKDPIELHLSLLPKGFVQKFEDQRNMARHWPFKSDRLRNVIELARDRSGWGKPVAKGRALGFAAHWSFFSYAAQVAEVSIGEGGLPKIHRIVCVIDCGIAVNPDGVRAQMEGGIVYGLAAALAQKITIDKGAVQQSNFHDFPLLALPDMPVVDVHIVQSGEAPTGTGEPGLPPATAAVANAMFKLTGKRVRTLPLS